MTITIDRLRELGYEASSQASGSLIMRRADGDVIEYDETTSRAWTHRSLSEDDLTDLLSVALAAMIEVMRTNPAATLAMRGKLGPQWSQRVASTLGRRTERMDLYEGRGDDR